MRKSTKMSEPNFQPVNDNISNLEKIGIEYMPPEYLDKLGLQRKEDAKTRKNEEILDKVFRLSKIMANIDEIAAILRMSKQTLYEIPGFAETVKRGHEEGKLSLRRAQFKKAIKKQNTDMLIWLGKNYLGQKETIETEVTIRPQVVLTQEQEGLFEPSALINEEEPPRLEDGTGAE